MKLVKCILKGLKDIQIRSALIWAITILLCSYVNNQNYALLFMTTAAALHTTLLSEFIKLQTSKVEKKK